MEINPFSTTFGVEPSNYINRLAETNKVIEDFSSPVPSNYVYIITGIRGSGKTVLMSSIAKHFASLDDWIVVDPGPKNNILENIASELYETTKVKKLFVKGEFSFSFQGITFSLKGKEPVSSVLTLLKKMLNYLKKDKRILITIDEVDNSEQMRTFIQTYESLIRQGYPIMLLMTGLYDNISKLQDEKSLTFLYRAPKIYLGPLQLNSVAYNYQKYLGVDEECSLKLATLTQGYAYAYQVLGYLLFKYRKKSVDGDILVEYDQYLSEYVYEKLYSELSSTERNILRSFANEKQIKMSDLALNANIHIKLLSVYRDRLIKRGIIYSPSYGYLAFSLPRFKEFLRVKEFFELDN